MLKKKVCTALLVLSLLALVVSLSACEVPDDEAAINAKCYLLSSYIVVENENGMAEESAYWNGISFDSATAEKTKTVNFLGQTYSGEYVKSRHEIYNSFATDYYKGEQYYELGVNSQTGELVCLNLCTNEFLELEQKREDVDNPETALLQEAKKYAAQFITVDDYQMSLEVSDRTSDGEVILQYYTYTFAKYVNNRKTMDYLSVKMTSKGNLASIWVGEAGMLTEDTCASIDEYEKVNIMEMLEDYSSDEYAVRYEIDEVYYARNKEGKIVMCVRAIGTWQNEGSAEELRGGFEFVIK